MMTLTNLRKSTEFEVYAKMLSAKPRYRDRDMDYYCAFLSRVRDLRLVNK